MFQNAKSMLEYNIKKINGCVVKIPRRGFEFKVERDAKLFNFLRDITPPTCYDNKRNIIIQKYIEGRNPTDKELEHIRKEIEMRGVIPRGITKSDVIIDKYGKFYLVDVGNFEIKASDYHKTKIPYCDKTFYNKTCKIKDNGNN